MFSIEQRRSDDLHLRTNNTNDSNHVALYISNNTGGCCDNENIIDGMISVIDNGHDEPIVTHTTTAATGMMRRKKSQYSFDTSCCNVEVQQHQQQQPFTSLSISSGVSSSSSASDGESTASSSPETLPILPQEHRSFLDDIRQLINCHQQPNLYDSTARKILEPHLRRARIAREVSRGPQYHEKGISASIASSMGVPYTALRKECPFLFDVSSYPLHTVLAQALGVETLTQIHTRSSGTTKDEVLSPLRDKDVRTPFHSVYDSFVTSFCIPLLHSMAISKGVIHQSTSDRVYYRYQAFPHIHVVCPSTANDAETMYTEPTCDSSLGYSLGCLTFYIPLTPSANNIGTNCLYVESHPGKEDWHPLTTKSIGLGYLFDGTRCLQFDVPPSGTDTSSRVAIMFRVLIYRDDSYDETTSATTLCPRNVRDTDIYHTESSKSPSSFYDEAYIDIRSTHAVVKKYSQQRGTILIDPPSPLLGHPFV